jgi:hypothetical protein
LHICLHRLSPHSLRHQTFKIKLLQSKSRVGPLQKTTLPRMELLACTIGSRLAYSVVEAIGLQDVPIRYWSDSMTALAWIKRSEEWKVFVGNRVKEIRTLSDPPQRIIRGEFSLLPFFTKISATQKLLKISQTSLILLSGRLQGSFCMFVCLG